ncbi:ankyrin repeat protein, putative [Trichomonas vaginalis G3]|uniref:Ankyrin repeat protein, putative n=1 Tax=Trichomonas vaginalis (strain ATCC PRA-98 / G3) TaxID=412133 RepID=A2FTS9_TRIV3|nr:ankyrin repeat and protein kinase domain-containing protein family [Trichomonas vaginalis G3]EAX91686.1 ankyrin repeat protein, putative [Trichomonas vaginalis G3]KAI5541978.1 ankyrin repeat and protein kinase domain-containing protein family [Trichomonas vaginalis G3]|eukprot:XP_001304616.1 ankyrin repeat protein [Trichomonas vaginalis G3]
MNRELVDKLIQSYSDYDKLVSGLYRLNTIDENEITKIYEDIKKILIESKINSPSQVIILLETAATYNNRYLRSYWNICKKIFEEFHPSFINVSATFDYFFYKEYQIVFRESHRKKFKEFESKGYSLDLHGENSIYRAIMNNDLQSLIPLTEMDGFNIDQTLKCEFYPKTKEGSSFLELCCYHGSADCFKYFRSKFNSEITEQCLRFSFLGGNSVIMIECLKYIVPDEKCMDYAIISHNIDFVTYLMNVKELGIYHYMCGFHRNIHLFFMCLSQEKNLQRSLVCSIYFNILPLCQLLISNGANIAEQVDGLSALHIAAENNCKEITEFIIKNGVDVNVKNSVNATPLHFAAYYNSIDAAEILIANGADIEVRDVDGKTPLHVAAENNSAETLLLLIDHGANINVKDVLEQTALLYAAQNYSIDSAKILLEHKADINIQDSNGSAAIHYASYSDSTEMLSLLLSNGADINLKDNNGMTPLTYAIPANKKDVFEFLVSHGADIKTKYVDGGTILHHVARVNSLEIAEFLISQGADFNEVDNSGESILHIAAFSNSLEMTKYIISLGVDINSRNINKETPLHYATKSDSKEVMEFLITNGADLNAQDIDGRTPLHYAVLRNNSTTLELLISHGATIDSKDNNGQTALHNAAYDGRSIQIVQILVSHGIDINAKDKNQETALQIARNNENTQMAAFLVAKGAK